MTKSRLEAFSDAVIAIIMTIMVLEIKAPHGQTFADLTGMLPTFLSYLLSYAFLGIYWNNHHHMLHTIERVNGTILWANIHLLFWLSLIPFATDWLGEHPDSAAPVALYGAVLLLCAAAYTILQNTIIFHHGSTSKLKHAVGNDSKGKLSLALYLTALICAFWIPWFSIAIYVLVACIWLVPDRRIEKII